MENAPFRGYEEARRYLYSLRHHGSKYGLERMWRLAGLLGNPERRFPVVHVAGTNGKGSTCAMLESIYRAAGYKTGLYTSPHLVFQGERIQVNRTLLPAEAILDYANFLRPHATALGAGDPDAHPSFFEFMTAMAFLHFAREKVDVGIIEVGLGGRLDATNIVQPEVSAITSIGLDHQEILGDTREKIAAEKAGILKPGRPAVIGHLPPDAEAVVRAIARERGCPHVSIAERFGTELDSLPRSALPGDYQRWNAATATLVAETARGRLPVTDAAIRQGLDSVAWAGRWERHEIDGRTLILDTSHNEEGARVLADNLDALRRGGGPSPHFVVGVLGEDRARPLLSVVARHAASITFLRPAQPRALAPEALAALLPAGQAVSWRAGSVAEAFPGRGRVAIGQPGDTVVVTGSIYLVGEIMQALFHGLPAADSGLQDLP